MRYLYARPDPEGLAHSPSRRQYGQGVPRSPWQRRPPHDLHSSQTEHPPSLSHRMEPARAARASNPTHCSSAPIRMPLQVPPKPNKAEEKLADTKTEGEWRDSAEREKNRISQDAALLLSPSPRGTWTAFQNRCWLRLLEDAPKMKTEESMRAAFKLLVDCFPFLEREEDKEKTVDMVYDCCEPDVTIEVRKLGCGLLLRLSEKCNMPKLIQRNIDVLCQLLSIVEGDKAHLVEITAAIQQHFVCFPRLALNVLFAKNLRPLREETGEWVGPCLSVVREQIQFSSTNLMELDIALCKCIQDEWNVRHCNRDVKSSDVQLFLSLAGHLKLDWNKPPTTSLASQAACSLTGLSGLIVSEIVTSDSIGKDSEHAALSAPAEAHPCSPGASIDELKALLRMTLCICHEYTAGGSRIAAFTKLLHGLLPARGNATNDVIPPLLHLPGDSIVYFLRQLCIFAISSSSSFSFDAAQLSTIQEALAWTLESLFPSIDKLKEAHFSSDFRIEAAEALMVACTIFIPIRRQGISCMETTTVKARLQGLYAQSQAVLSDAKAERGKVSVEPALVQAAHTVHRIATEYLKVPNRRAPPSITAAWLKEERGREAQCVNTRRRESPDANREHEKRQRRSSCSAKPGTPLQGDRQVVVAVRGRGHTFAPPSSPGEAGQDAKPAPRVAYWNAKVEIPAPAVTFAEPRQPSLPSSAPPHRRQGFFPQRSARHPDDRGWR